MISLQELKENIIAGLREWADEHTDAEFRSDYFKFEQYKYLSELPTYFDHNWQTFDLRDIAADIIARNNNHEFSKCTTCGIIFDNNLGHSEDDCYLEDGQEFSDECEDITVEEMKDYIENIGDWNLECENIPEQLAQYIIDNAYDEDFSADARNAADSIDSAEGYDIILELLKAGELQHHNGNLLQDHYNEEWYILGQIRQLGIQEVYSKEEIEEFLGDAVYA